MLPQAVYYYWYSTLRQAAVQRHAAALGRELLDRRSANITVAESLLVAAAAGCINVLATNPIWLLATRMQATQRTQQQYDKEGLGLPKVGVLQVGGWVGGGYRSPWQGAGRVSSLIAAH